MWPRAAAALAILSFVFLLGEFALPRIAENRVRAELEKQGEVENVDVDAFPAWKLLTGRADSIAIEMGRVEATQIEFVDALDRLEKVGEIDLHVEVLQVGRLRVQDMSMNKVGRLLTSEATLTDADLDAALPPNFGVQPIQTGDGSLLLEATVPLLGAVRARVSPRDGALVIAPDGLVGSIASITVFRDPRLHVTQIGAEPRPGGFAVQTQARLT